MTTAWMVTSSPEDIRNIIVAKDIISFVTTLISSNDGILEINGNVITKEDIHLLDSYFDSMYNFLLNPGLNEEDYIEIQELS